MVIMPTHAEDIIVIGQSIEVKENCHVFHTGSIQCKASTDLIPNGLKLNVETYELTSHATAKIAYAWKLRQDRREDPPRIIIRLGIPPDTSPYQAFNRWVQENF